MDNLNAAPAAGSTPCTVDRVSRVFLGVPWSLGVVPPRVVGTPAVLWLGRRGTPDHAQRRCNHAQRRCKIHLTGVKPVCEAPFALRKLNRVAGLGQGVREVLRGQAARGGADRGGGHGGRSRLQLLFK